MSVKSIEELLVELTCQVGALIERLDRIQHTGGLVPIDRIGGSDSHFVYIRKLPVDADPPR